MTRLTKRVKETTLRPYEPSRKNQIGQNTYPEKDYPNYKSPKVLENTKLYRTFLRD